MWVCGSAGRERECVCVCVCVSECARVRERACVPVCVCRSVYLSDGMCVVLDYK